MHEHLSAAAERENHAAQRAVQGLQQADLPRDRHAIPLRDVRGPQLSLEEGLEGESQDPSQGNGGERGRRSGNPHHRERAEGTRGRPVLAVVGKKNKRNGKGVKWKNFWLGEPNPQPSCPDVAFPPEQILGLDPPKIYYCIYRCCSEI